MSFSRTLIASLAMLFTMILLVYVNRADDHQPNKPLSTFPVQLNEWTGEKKYFDSKIYDKLGVDDSFLCSYSAPGGRHVELYVGFYESQREGDLIHSPKNCLPGAGWKIVKTSLEEINVAETNPQKIKVIKLIIQKRSQRQVVLYWFQSRGRFIASEYLQKIYLVIDSIVRHRTDGSFVRLISPIVDDNEKKTETSLKDFTRLLIPILQEYLPA